MLSADQILILRSLATILPIDRFRELHDCITLNKLIRFEIFLKDIPGISRLKEKLKINSSISDKSFKVLIDKGMDNWASAVVDCSDRDLKAMRFVYLHPDKGVCEVGKELDANNDDMNLGVLLNYPKCCIESYLHWQQDNEDIDPITIITSHHLTGRINSFNFPNPFSRYFGSGLFSHFPCSFNCSETFNIANNSLKSLQINFPLIANSILELENSFVIFNKEIGICLWSHFHSIESKIKLNKHSFHGQGKIKNIFKTIETIEILDTTLYLQSSLGKITTFKTDECVIAAFNNIS